MLGRTLAALRSRRLTVGLIASLAAVFVLGTVIPQKALLGRDAYLAWRAARPGLVGFLEALGLTDISTAPLTLALWCFFFLNLSLVMAGRIPALVNRCRIGEPPDGPEALRGWTSTTVLRGAGVQEAVSALRRCGYAVAASDAGFRAARNRLSPLATILFHLSFFLLLAGGVLTFYTRSRAVVHLAEGETFRGRYAALSPPRIGEMPSTTFTVESIVPRYYRGYHPVGLDVVLRTPRGTVVMGVNRPHRDAGLTFVVTGVDVAPLFVLEDEGGRELDGAYVKLKVLEGRDDTFTMGGTEFRVRFHPDIEAANVTEDAAEAPRLVRKTESPAGPRREVVNPAVTVSARREDGVLVRATLRPGGRISLDGRRLVFRELRYWAGFHVGSERGLGLVYTGFALISAALAVRFLRYRREVAGVRMANELHVAGRAEFFPALFRDEFQNILKDMKPGSARPGGERDSDDV